MKKEGAVFWLLKRMRRRLPALLLMTAVHAGQALLAVAFALGSRGVIDGAVAGSSPQFLRACLIQASIILGTLICLTLYRHLRERLMADLDRDWKRDLIHGLLYGEYASVSAYHSGELLNRLNNDVRVVNEGILNTLPNAISMMVKLVAAFVVLAALDLRFTMIIVAAGVVVVASTIVLRRKLKGLNKRVSQADGKVSGFVQETLEKLLMVQAMDVAGEMERRVDGLMEQRWQLQRRRKNVSLFANTAVSMMYYGAGFAALVWCSFRLLRGQMTFGALTAVTQLVSQLQAPFVNLSGVIPQYIAMTAAAERLMELEDISGEKAADQNAAEVYAAMDALTAENLTFSYGRDVVLNDTAFTLPKGAFAVITGPSGAGKSTILKLMLGIFQPASGGIYLKAGETLVRLDRSTRKLFAYVPQGNLLLSGTLRENLTLVRPEATEEELRRAIYISAMEEYLSQLPDGLDTVLGESGAGLSEGQVQRLAIARAVLSGAPVLLLDEITSSLDAETEQTVLERICQLPDRTCIAVTHRPAALELADWELKVSGQEVRCVRR